MTTSATPYTPSTIHELAPIAFTMLLVGIVVFGLGLPASLLATHGFNLSLWPNEAPNPQQLVHWLLNGRASEIVSQYKLMFDGLHDALPTGGRWHFWGLFGLTFVITALWLVGRTKLDDGRDPSGVLGDARWANKTERRVLDRGLEIGMDLETGQSIRISTDGNLLTIAPPRTGKTSGLIINNLLAPDQSAWDGPAVVLDPKGDIYEAVHERRAALGRRVIKFDLTPGAKSSERWNPLENANVKDIARLQTVASVLIPNMGDTNAYFGIRGIDILVGAMAVALEDSREQGRGATPADVAALLSDHPRFLAVAKRLHQQIFRSAQADLELDERARDALLSTARSAVQWLQDELFQQLTSDATFTMDEIAAGEADLFIIFPKESSRILGPLLRWMFSELFMAIRRRKGAAERIVMFVDEADSLGKFDELRTALTLMPGLGVSVWSFWQSFSQIEENYGKHGAETFQNSAAVTTISNIAHLSEDAEKVSRALGDFTLLLQADSAQETPGGQTTGTSRNRQARRLLKANEAVEFDPEELIVLLNLANATRHPLRLRKSKYWKDPRYSGLYHNVVPVGAL